LTAKAAGFDRLTNKQVVRRRPGLTPPSPGALPRRAASLVADTYARPRSWETGSACSQGGDEGLLGTLILAVLVILVGLYLRASHEAVDGDVAGVGWDESFERGPSTHPPCIRAIAGRGVDDNRRPFGAPARSSNARRSGARGAGRDAAAPVAWP